MPVDEGTIAFAHRLADVSGVVIRPFFRQRIDVADKGLAKGSVFDPVTAADKGAEEAMRAVLERGPGGEVIRKAGYGDLFLHRTGHSIGVTDHGQGANMDNLETHDTRALLPMTGFSIEPGIYLPHRFGIRSEVDACILPGGKLEVRGGEAQREVPALLAPQTPARVEGTP